MTIPMIHLNGTSKERLIDALGNASNALNDAYLALKETAPNGRDYYPLGPEAMESATQEHMSRLRQVDAVKKEIDDMAGAIYDA